MKILVNNLEREVTERSSVADLLISVDIHDPRGLAVAVNDQAIPRTEWSETMLHEHDDVVLLLAAQGG